MTKLELDQQIIAVKKSQKLLADSYNKISKAIKRIEEIAQKQEGELTKKQADDHTKLVEYKEKILVGVTISINFYEG